MDLSGSEFHATAKTDRRQAFTGSSLFLCTPYQWKTHVRFYKKTGHMDTP